MNKINGYWIDENGNGWNANIYTEEQAMQYSDTLVNCRYCHNCHNCHNCQHCYNCCDCQDCRRCHNCHNCQYCHNCQNCYDCRYCQSCQNCCYCHNCYDYAKNPQRYVTPKIGSRNDNTTIYWTNKDDAQVVCGCFRGNLEEWEDAINETHKDNQKCLREYLKELKIIKIIINFDASK